MMKYLAVVLVLILNYSCSLLHNNYTPLQNLTWLEGKWEQKMSKAILFEEWKMVNNELHGSSYQVKDQDTIYLENLKIYNLKEGSTIRTIYQAEVFNQNEGTVIQFTLRKMLKKEPKNIWFDNKNHDFPQHINYRLIHKDSLYAQIEGVNRVGFKNVKFNFNRVK